MPTINIVGDIGGMIDGMTNAGGVWTYTTTGVDETVQWLENLRRLGLHEIVNNPRTGTYTFSQAVNATAEGATRSYGLASYGTTAVTNAETGLTTYSVSGLEADAGLNVIDGGLTFGVQAVQLGAAVLIGAGYGIKSYHDYPEFWTDLSEGLFDGIGGSEVMPVIARATSNGGIQNYVRETDINTIVENMHNLVKTNPEVEVSPDIPDPGYDKPISTSIDFEGANLAYAEAIAHSSTPVTPAATVLDTYNEANRYFQAQHPGHTPNAMQVSAAVFTQYGQNKSSCQVTLAEMPDRARIQELLVHSALTRMASVDTAPSASVTGYYKSDGSFDQYTNYRSSGGSASITAGLQADSTGAQYGTLYTSISATPAVIYDNNPNKDTDPATFWDTFANWKNRGFTVPRWNPQTRQQEYDKYIPLNIPQFDPDEDTQPQQDTAQSGEQDNPNPIVNPLKIALPWIFPPITIPDIPIGDTPEPPAPTPAFTESQALWSIYNPTYSELNSLGAYLWTSNIIDIIEKFFKNSPMEAIISLHMIYCTPTTQGRRNIVLGYLDSGVASDVVSSQYEEIDCGTVHVGEYFMDCRDYVNTQLDVFLPFIGIRRVDTADLMGADLNIIYKVDVLTGTILAQLFIERDGTRQCMYTFEGNCAVQIPLTSADRSRLISGLVGVASSAIGGMAAGGPAGAVAGAVGGAVHGLSNSATISRAGNLSGNSGSMGIKVPYLLITRQRTNDLGDYYATKGAPASYTTTIDQCHGLTVVRDVIINNIPCTATEKDIIENTLKNGIII